VSIKNPTESQELQQYVPEEFTCLNLSKGQVTQCLLSDPEQVLQSLSQSSQIKSEPE
jgi:hypothetical protein